MDSTNIKYGLIAYNNAKTQGWNYGDTVQTLAVEEVYKRIGITSDMTERIEYEELSSYACAGDYKIKLPMQGCFEYKRGLDAFPLSKDIIPVYVGFSRISGSHIYKSNFADYGPIGCRDEATYRKLKRKGFDAFLSGCYTICFPKREQPVLEGKIFMVDAPKGIEEFIPEEYRERLVYVTHETNTNVDLEKKTRELLDMYKEQAQLIITSRLHCASPCMAMGIPVILARDYFDSRYEWIDKYLPLYTPDKYASINWRPDIVDLEEIKDKLVELFKSEMERAGDVAVLSAGIHEHYMTRDKADISIPFMTKMYWKMLAISPKLAYFIRKKLLKRFTVMNEGDK